MKVKVNGGNGVGKLTISSSSVPSAMFSAPGSVGMSDIRGHVISWLVGYTYVGNGTLGATDSLYLLDPTKTYTATAQNGTFNVPLLEGDAVYGESYALDVIKHYARIRRTRMTLTLFTLQPSTTNSCVVLVGPYRGASAAAAQSTNTTAGATYANTIAMKGCKSLPSYGSMTLDFTPYIAGGSGPAQNEFAIASQGVDALASIYSTGVVPCGFTVSGSNSTSGLRGTTVHSVVASVQVDLLDFIGGNVSTNIEARSRYLAERKCQDVSSSSSSSSSSASLSSSSAGPREGSASSVEAARPMPERGSLNPPGGQSGRGWFA